MAERSELIETLNRVFSHQLLAVLATQGPQGPYGSLVAFAATMDLKYLLFATLRSTRKFKNLEGTPKASMVIDDRMNEGSDFDVATAVTATGATREILSPDEDHFRKFFLAKHPSLSDFAANPDCAFLMLKVDTYFIVHKFQRVEELHFES